MVTMDGSYPTPTELVLSLESMVLENYTDDLYWKNISINRIYHPISLSKLASQYDIR